MATIKQITWEQILPIWRDHLWRGRKTEIRPTSGLKFLGGFDKSIEDNIPTFFGAFIEGECVGVNSGHITNEQEYRSRGIYVIPNHRGKGISQDLLEAVERQVRAEKRITLWSMPRKLALPAYEKFGFSVVSDFFDEMEFGPNCFVVKLLEDIYE
jgi:GNAT superfamily N-acetyltransferase